MRFRVARSATPEAASTPVLPLAVPLALPLAVDEPSSVLPVNAITPIPLAVAVAEVSTGSRDSEGGADKSDPYHLSAIFVSLISGSRKSEIMPLLQVGLAKAKERDDDLYAAIFEGGIAANLPEPDLKQSIATYHRALDFSERRPDAPHGFLHSMIWNLFTATDDSPEAAELMERARRNLRRARSSSEQDNELLQEAWAEFEKLPGFMEQVGTYRTVQGRESANVVNKLLRESRLDKSKTLLLFPRSRSCWTNNDRPLSSINSRTCGNYFFWRNGCGTVINPDGAFVDNFYRVGGVLRDIHNIVLTVSPSNGGNPLAQLQTLFGLLHQANVSQAVRFFVHPAIALENDAELRCFERSGTVESIHSLNSGSESELRGGGVLTFRNGSFLLALPENKTIQFLDRATDDLANKADELGERRDVVVFPVETIEELVWAARLVRLRKPKLTVFDLPRENNHLLLLHSSVRDFVGPETPVTYADSALALDVLEATFVDCVKAFTVCERDCWSGNGRLAFGSEGHRPPEGLLFFAEEAASRFADEGNEILEAFLHNRRCRRGLYFA